MNFSEIFGKNVTYDDIKVTQKQSIVFSLGSIFFEIYSLGESVDFFFE